PIPLSSQSLTHILCLFLLIIRHTPTSTLFPYTTLFRSFLHISLPKQDQYIPEFFYENELKELFKVNDISTPLGQRNQALLETFYATGLRVSEAAALQIQDIDFQLSVLK